MTTDKLDLSNTIIPKSDQLNADDLVGGSKVFTITGIRRNSEADDAPQPVSIALDNDTKRPWKPCKTMRKILVGLWGEDGYAWVGKSLELYRDPDVTYGGIALGGIRIRAMSHIEKTTDLMLMESSKKRKVHTIHVLEIAGAIKTPANQNDAGGSEEKAPTIDVDAVIQSAFRYAAKGSESYKEWFAGDKERGIEGLSGPVRMVLINETRPNKDDFDKPAPVHDLCKAIAKEADEAKAQAKADAEAAAEAEAKASETSAAGNVDPDAANDEQDDAPPSETADAPPSEAGDADSDPQY